VHKRALALEGEEDIEGAFNLLEEAYKENPNNRKIAEDRTRIAMRLCLEWLGKEEDLPSENLPMRQSYLLKAKAINALPGIRSDIIESYIMSPLEKVNAQIEIVGKKVAQANQSQSKVKSCQILWGLREYEPYLENVRELKQKLYLSIQDMESEIDQLISAGKAAEAIVICLIIENAFQEKEIIEDKLRSVLFEKAQRLLDLSRKCEEIAGDDRLATSLLYALAAYRLCPSNSEIGSRIDNLLPRFEAAYILPTSVELSGALSTTQKKEFLDIFEGSIDPNFMAFVPKGDKAEDCKISVRVILNDLAIKTKRSRKSAYSKYRAGNRQIANPEFVKLQMEYAHACKEANESLRKYEETGSGVAELNYTLRKITADLIYSRLSKTPPYIEEPVYQDYQYWREEVVFKTSSDCTYAITDAQESTLLKSERIEETATTTRTAIEGTHPEDINQLADLQIDQKEAEGVLSEFREEQFEVLTKKILEVIRMAHHLRARKSLEAGYEDAAREEILAFRLLSLRLGKNASEAKEVLARRWQLMPVTDEIDKALFAEYSEAVSVVTSLLDLPMLCKNTAGYEKGESLPDEFRKLDQLFAAWNPMVIEYEPKDRLVSERKSRTNETPSKEFVALPSKREPDKLLSPQQVIKVASPAVVVVETLFGVGSGFVIDPRGYILTNYHVIQEARDVMVKMKDGGKFFAELASKSISKDLALLKVEAQNLPFIPMALINEVAVGQAVLAIGAPGSIDDSLLEQTATKGIISGIRQLKNQANPDVRVRYIQTDAAINPGNSGGPLLNMRGQAVGVNTQKVIGTSVEGLGFAIAMDEVKEAFAQELAQ
jgi:hypothetical protein